MQVISTFNIDYTIIAMEAVRWFRISINSIEFLAAAQARARTRTHPGRTCVYHIVFMLSSLYVQLKL